MSSGGGKKTKAEKSRHNIVSQAGRQKINDQISIIKELLPETNKVDCNKANVLVCAVKSIENFEQVAKDLQEKTGKLYAENRQLRTLIEHTIQRREREARMTMHGGDHKTIHCAQVERRPPPMPLQPPPVEMQIDTSLEEFKQAPLFGDFSGYPVVFDDDVLAHQGDGQVDISDLLAGMGHGNGLFLDTSLEGEWDPNDMKL